MKSDHKGLIQAYMIGLESNSLGLNSLVKIIKIMSSQLILAYLMKITTKFWTFPERYLFGKTLHQRNISLLFFPFFFAEMTV